jgi:cytochrome c553
MRRAAASAAMAPAGLSDAEIENIADYIDSLK